MSHASGDRARRAWLLSDLRDGTRATRRQRRRSQPGARGHDETVHRLDAGHAPYPAVHGFRALARQSSRAADSLADQELAAARSRHARRVVGWLAVLPARLGVGRESSSQHVHAHRARRWRGIRLQPRCDSRSRHPAALIPHARRGGRLLRTCRRHRRPGAARTSARIAGARPHERGNSRPPQPGAAGRSPDRRDGQ